MFRRGFLKAALGASAAVALGEMGFGKQEAEAQNAFICASYSYACSPTYGGTCGPTCKVYCRQEPYRSCAMCDDVRNGSCPAPTPPPTPDPCASTNTACSATFGGACGAYCDQYCASFGTCPVCQDRVC